MADLIPLGPFPDAAGYGPAVRLDETDALAEYRSRFVPAEPGLIYLDGNSLGRLPIASVAETERVVGVEWGERLIRSWRDRWWELAQTIGDSIAPLIGADPGSVIIGDSTTVNLFKLAWGLLRLRPDRRTIITDNLNFPTDIYALRAAGDAAGGCSLAVCESRDGIIGPEEKIIARIDSDTALVSLSHVAFKSGYLYDMERITAAAHEAGALVLWDLSHSVGVVPAELGRTDAAVGCTYKYLNGGPGSPAFLYVNPELGVTNPLRGWWGHAAPFDFDLEFNPASGIAGFQTGTMPILSLSAIEPAVAMVAEAGIDAIRTKSVDLTSYLVDLFAVVLAPLGFTLGSPTDARRRGSHVSVRHPDAWRVNQAMINDARVLPDFRSPDNIRLGLAPLYTRFADVHTAIHRIAAVVADRELLAKYPADRSAVT